MWFGPLEAPDQNGQGMFGNRWKTNKENHKQRNGRNETTGENTPKIDGQCMEDHDGTCTITRIKMEHIKGQKKIKRISFSS